MARPILTIVAPSSMATSKSFVMPIERCVMLTPGMTRSSISSLSARSRRKHGRTSSGSRTRAPTVMSPITRSPGRPAICATAPAASSGGSPFFVPSPEVFTSTRTFASTPAASARAETSRASLTLSTDWMRSKSESASRTLFVWR